MTADRKTCIVSGCPNVAHRTGLCQKHYRRQCLTGTTDRPTDWQHWRSEAEALQLRRQGGDTDQALLVAYDVIVASADPGSIDALRAWVEHARPEPEATA